MEWAPGGTLLQLLQAQDHQWSHLQLLQLALQIANALQYLHTLQPPIAHLDVKP